MCLYVDKVKTEQAKLREEDCVTRYKLVAKLQDNTVVSWYHPKYKWQIGCRKLPKE